MLSVSIVDASHAVRVAGDAHGHDLEAFCDALAGVVTQQEDPVILDLSGLESWSLIAQAMVLRTERVLQSRGRHLVLLGPSPGLRAHGDRLNVFGTVETIQTSSVEVPHVRRRPAS